MFKTKKSLFEEKNEKKMVQFNYLRSFGYFDTVEGSLRSPRALSRPVDQVPLEKYGFIDQN